MQLLKPTKAFKDTVAFAITNVLLSVINTAETQELFWLHLYCVRFIHMASFGLLRFFMFTNRRQKAAISSSRNEVG